jgi:enoyl-CoA hydratase/carnithine racemase
MHAWGIVTEIVPPDQLLGRAQALAQHLAAAPRNAIARTKTDILTFSNRTADAKTASRLSFIRTIHVPPQIRKPGSD